MNSKTGVARTRERVPTGRRGRPSKSMIAAALERPFCAYLHKVCLNNRLEGHKYCIDHIMNDKTAPYRQCTFAHPLTGRRCSRAAHKVDRRASPLCSYHRALKMNAIPKPLPPQPMSASPASQSTAADDGLTVAPMTAPPTPSSAPLSPNDPKALLNDLRHHRHRDSIAQREPSANTFWLIKEDGSAKPSEKLHQAVARFNSQRSLDEMVTPLEMPTMEEIAARHNNADSDTESVDNNLDLLKHASVFTEEELTRTLRDKMINLRRLYIEQYGHIQYILKEKRLKYIQAQRIEDELYGEQFSYRNQLDSPDYSKLRAMLKYHKASGEEALLQEQARRRKMSRMTAPGSQPQPHTASHHQCAGGSSPTKAAGPSLAGGDTSSKLPASNATTAATTSAPADLSAPAAAPPTTNATAMTTSTLTPTATTASAATTMPTTTAPTTAAPTTTAPSTIAPTTATASTTTSAPTAATTAALMTTTTNSTAPTKPTNQSSSLTPYQSVCIFAKTIHGCDKPSLPLSPYCKRHILYDPKQVLFRPCAGGIKPCLTPVVSYVRKNRCWLHTAIN